MGIEDGFHIFDVWEIDVDPCDICGETASQIVALTDPLRLKRLCGKHAGALGVETPSGPATCCVLIPRPYGSVPCGAVASHVELIGYYDHNQEPTTQFCAVCRNHLQGA
jgi:hypothetical protein